MARFRGTIKGQRGEASRLGSIASGLRVEANGWHVGIEVTGQVTLSGDRFEVWVTGGSNGGGRARRLGCVMHNEKTGEIIMVEG